MTDRFSQVKTDVLQTLFNSDIQLKNNIVPDSDNAYDIGTPANRIRTIYANTTIGTVSNANVDTDNLRFPFSGGKDIKLTRSGTSQLTIDNNAGGAAQVVVNGSIQATSVNATTIAATALRNVSITPGTPNTGDVLKATSGSTAAWQASGDVTGPSSAGNNDVVLFDGTTGKLVKDSNVNIDNSGNISTPGGVTAASITSPDNKATSLRNVALPLTAPALNQILRATSATTAEWANVVGTGDVVGPNGATDNAIALYDGTTGKTIKQNNFWSINSVNNNLISTDGTDTFFSLSPSIGSVAAVTTTTQQPFLTARRRTDTNQRVTIQNDGTYIVGTGLATEDLRLSRSAASTLTIDNNSTGAATLASNAGTLSNFATITRAGALAITTSSGNGSITYTTNGSGNHVFNSTTGNVQINRPITTSAGDLTINPAGTNIACSSKNLTGVASIQTTSVTTAAGDISINPTGSNINMNSKTLSNVATITSAVDLSLNPTGTNVNCNSKTLSNVATITSAADLSLNPTGNIVCNNKILTNVSTLGTSGIDMGPGTSTLGTPKLQVFNNGGRYGFGIQPAVFSYETPNATDKHIFYTASTERLRMDSGGALFSVPIGTVSGDLSVNPAGSNINCNNKTLTNAVLDSSSVNIRSLCNTKAVGTNFGSFSTVSFDFFPAGDILQGSLSIPANYFNTLGKGCCIEATLNVNVASGTFTFSSFLNATLVQSGVISAASSVWLVRLQLQTEAIGTTATIGYNFSMTPVTGTTTQINAVSSGLSHTTANALVIRFAGIFSASASQQASMGGLTIVRT